MKNELTSPVTVFSWPALFITFWLDRDLNDTNRDLDTHRAHAARNASSSRQRPSRLLTRRSNPARLTSDTDGLAPQPAEPDRDSTSATDGSPSQVERDSETTASRTGVATGRPVPASEVPWFELDLFPPTKPKTGSRFDDTIAAPIDAPQRLDAIVLAAGLRLRALPPVQELGHRTVAYRARLQRIARDAAQARARLADATYGRCLTCADDISLAVLTDRPWARQCTYCELDI